MGGEAIEARRGRIAGIDAQLVDLVAERLSVAREIGDTKWEAGAATLDPAREVAVVRSAVERARRLGLPEEPVRELFWILVRLCREAQLEERLEGGP
jgi:chorismate mutase